MSSRFDDTQERYPAASHNAEYIEVVRNLGAAGYYARCYWSSGEARSKHGERIDPRALEIIVN